MARYLFARPCRAALLDQLIAAGFDARTPVDLGEAETWVECPPERFDAAAAVVAAHDAAAIDAAAAKRAQQQAQARAAIIATAQGAVGVALSALTPAQQQACLAVLLWRLGAVTPQGTVAPLAAWADGPARG